MTDILRTPANITYKNAEEARTIFAEEVAEWLGKAAAVADVVRSEFAAPECVQSSLISSPDSGQAPLARLYTFKRVRLPEHTLASPYDGSPVLRESAACLSLYYNAKRFPRDDASELPFPTPIPNEAKISSVAIATKDDDPRYYPISTEATVSGAEVTLSWHTRERGGSTPDVFFPTQDPGVNYVMMSTLHPDDRRLPGALENHRGWLEGFAISLGAIATALQMPELNPKI